MQPPSKSPILQTLHYLLWNFQSLYTGVHSRPELAPTIKTLQFQVKDALLSLSLSNKKINKKTFRLNKKSYENDKNSSHNCIA